jgi:ABC-type bacteriocin/lantibiotic exporter with double-glycine peptidase domain
MQKPVSALLSVMALIVTLTGDARGSSVSLWLDVPFVAQSKWGCGPAAIAMVIEYWRTQGAPVAAEAANLAHIQRAIEPQTREGTPASAMERYFREWGFAVYAFRGSWNDLAHHLSRGRPLIVALRPAGSRSLHYIVLVGVDEARAVALVNDPARRKLLKVDRNEFQKGWKDTQDWTLLALPPGAPSRGSAP